MALTPLGHRFLIKADEVETTLPSGVVVVVDEKLEKAGQMRGTVVGVGPSAYKAFREINEDNGQEVNGRPWVQVGDYVLYARYAGKQVEDPTTKEEFVVCMDEDIVLRIDLEEEE
jgi:co-chaperonin GroES (HSP10)